MRLLRLLAAAALLPCLTGCHSAFIDAEIQNHTETPVSLVEIDYPSASFGTQTLMPGSTFHYRFKVLGSGPTKLIWTDGAHVEHTSPGPELKESDEGKLSVVIEASGTVWQQTLKKRKP